MGVKNLKKGTRCGVEKAILLTKYSWVAGRLSISIANASNNVLQPYECRFLRVFLESYMD